MKVKKDKFNHIIDIYRITVVNDSTIDIVAFGKTRKELLNYILSFYPRIKEGDVVEVKGKVSVYKGRYQIILNGIEDFKLIEKRNFEKDIYFSETPTNIYASRYGKVYHTLKDCPYGRRLNEENIIYFFSEEDAKKLGYKKCKWCEEHEKR
ncbi:OB-fold nucleic acid binding domain-containing protein [Methanocaldococcus villosus]|nr:OB-fold nucleic acid binding domain-containing protein [Methanocaldococcus villosus]